MTLEEFFSDSIKPTMPFHNCADFVIDKCKFYARTFIVNKTLSEDKLIDEFRNLIDNEINKNISMQQSELQYFIDWKNMFVTSVAIRINDERLRLKEYKTI